MTIRPSDHANEYVVLEQVRPDPTQAPTGFIVTEQKTSIDDFGATVTTPASWDMLPAAPGQRDTQTDLTEAAELGTNSYAVRLRRSNRSLIPIEIEVTVKDLTEVAPDFSKSFLLVGGETGSGAAMQLSERRYERWDDNAIAAHHNPNQAGAGQNGESPSFDAYRALRAYGGRPIHYASPAPNVHESCCSPLDFGSDPGNEGISDHGQDETHPIWWWRERIFQRVTLCYGGRACAHRIDYWSYTPTAWVHGDESDPLLSYRNPSMACVANYFDQAFIIDASTGGFAEITGFAPTAPDVDWNKTWDVSRWSLLGPSGLSPLAGARYVAVVMQNIADGFAVGIVLKLEDTDLDTNVFTALRVGAPNMISLAYARGANLGGTLTENANVAINLLSKSIGGRRAGWIGSTHYLVAGKFLDVYATIQELYTSGALDSPPPTDLPPAVTAGTIFPPESGTPTPLETVDVVLITGNSQLGVSSHGYLTSDLNPEVCKRPRSAPLFGSAPGVSTMDSRKMIWHDIRGRWEPLEHGANTSTFGDGIPTTFGLETTLVEGLVQRGISPWVIKLGYTGSPLGDRAGAVGVWNEPDVDAVQVTATVTVAAISGGATFTGPAGTFSGITGGMVVQIAGSAGGYLRQTGNQFGGPLPQLGNNTYRGRPLVSVGVSVDGSVLTVSNAAPGGVSFAFQTAETAPLTFRFGKLNLRTLAEESVGRALAELALMRKAARLRLVVVHSGEADKGKSAAQYQALVTDHVAWLRGVFNVNQTADDVAPAELVKLSPHGAGDLDSEVEAIRAAQDAAAAAIKNCVAIETNDLTLRAEGGPWPPADRSEVGVHLTPTSVCEIGWRCDRALDAFAFFPATITPLAQRLNPSGGTYYGLVTEVPVDGGTIASVDVPASPADIIAAIDQAIAAGADVLSYTINGRVVTARGFDELIRARKYFEGLLVRGTGVRRARVSF